MASRNWTARLLARGLGRLAPPWAVAFCCLTPLAIALLFVGCLHVADSVVVSPSPVRQPPTRLVIDREIRVRLLGGRTPASERLAVTASFTLTDPASQRVLDRFPALPIGSTVRAAPGGGLDLGGRVMPHGDVVIAPERDAAIVLADQTYRGRLRIRREGDALTFVNLVDVESYLRGVLRAELPRSFHAEAFKCQAVAARTYVLYETLMARGRGRIYDVNDNESSQMYAGVRGEDRIAVRAVEDTRGQVGVWSDRGEDRIFCTFYSSACGGRSQGVNEVRASEPSCPPLAGGVVCDDCSDAPHYRWGPVRLTKSEVTRRLVRRYPTLNRLGTITALRPKEVTSAGRIVRIELIGSGGQSDTLMGEDYRLALGGHTIKSTNHVIVTERDAFVFKDGKGFGHGMGLCQYGMNAKARRGMDYRRIFAAYYPGSEIRTLY